MYIQFNFIGQKIQYIFPSVSKKLSFYEIAGLASPPMEVGVLHSHKKQKHYSKVGRERLSNSVRKTKYMKADIQKVVMHEQMAFALLHILSWMEYKGVLATWELDHKAKMPAQKASIT